MNNWFFGDITEGCYKLVLSEENNSEEIKWFKKSYIKLYFSIKKFSSRNGAASLFKFYLRDCSDHINNTDQ
jgi:hypothetical protein